MKIKGWLFKIVFSSRSGDHLGTLLLRVFAALAMATHGYNKMFGGMERTTVMVERLGFPLPGFFAFAAAFSEFFGALFVALGFATRLSALLLVITMSVAVFIAHAGDPFILREKALMYLAVFVFMVFQGGGKISIDALIRRK